MGNAALKANGARLIVILVMLFELVLTVVMVAIIIGAFLMPEATRPMVELLVYSLFLR